MARINKSTVRRTARPDKTSTIVLGIFVVLAVATAIVGFIVVRNLVSSWNLTSSSNSLPGVAVSTPGSGSSTSVASGQPLQSDSGPTPVPWDGKSRVNILLMGLDFRDWQAGDTPRTDTMILLTIDPSTATAGMLSIPRDLWVQVENFGNDNGYNKINTAYYYGELYHLPGGGPALAMQTVENLLGVPIDYYVQLDFDAFVKIIDDIGGVIVTPSADTKVEPIGNPNGQQILKAGTPYRLDGELALSYARDRYSTSGSDFDRSKRQQDVIMAVKKRILSLNELPSLLIKAPSIYQDIQSGVHTNLSFDQALALAQIALQIDPSKITRANIGPDQLVQGVSPDGLDIYIPIPDKIRDVTDSIFTTGGVTAPMAVASDQQSAMQTEAARIVVENGSGTTGLADQTATYLKQQGLNVIQTANADQQTTDSIIYLYNSKPYTLAYLSTLFGVSSSNIYNVNDPSQPYDIVVIAGQTWANSNPMK
jgi:polyisoprenyl-teichoic acid--peptidoglycan teichoic acid transferase